MAKLNKQTLDDIDVSGQRVLYRADYNVPLEQGRIVDGYKISQSLPTLKRLLKAGARVVIMTHVGRPGGAEDMSLSVLPIKSYLESELGISVGYAADIYAEETLDLVNNLGDGQALMLENLRFWPGEDDNDKRFASRLAELGDILVQDAFGAAHRAHASTSALADMVDHAVAGDLMAREYQVITEATTAPHRPYVAVVGGAKVADKIDLLKTFVEQVDSLVIGGAMANNFLVAMGYDVEDSLVDAESVDQAQEILKLAKAQQKKRKFNLCLPQDVVVGRSIENERSPSIVDLSSFHYVETVFYPKKPPLNTIRLQEDEIIGDIGPYTAAYARGLIASARTVVWNGLVGVVETPEVGGEALGPFEFGSYYIAQEIIEQTKNGNLTSIAGGGDTAGYLVQSALNDGFSHVSTGGGASLELMLGRKLPAIEALDDA